MNKNQFMECAKANGFDFIVVNYIEGADYIERNAYLMYNVIKHINSTKGTKDKLIVVGPSMGGLITRLALAYMDSIHEEHHTRLYVSFDEPHKGANIPLGIQHWAKFFFKGKY